MPIHNEIDELLERVRQEWDSAEKNLKEAEQAIGRQVVPAINELRYAGRKIMDAIHAHSNEGNTELAKEHLNHALYSCHCAKHDAIDVCTSVIYTHVDAAVKQYGYHNVKEAFPDLPHMLTCSRDVKTKIAASREDRGNREKIYLSISNDNIQKLEIFYKSFLASEDAFSSLQWKNRLPWIIPLIVLSISSVIGLFGIFYNHPKPVIANSSSIAAAPNGKVRPSQ